jgi:copper homeostasis protein
MTYTGKFRLAPVALEVICTSVADARAAEKGGAARLELVVSLDRGGMTPPVALVDAVLAAVRVPVRVMVRATEAHQIEDAGTRTTLIEAAREIGARAPDGIVFGAVKDGAIDEALLEAIAAAAGRPVTFHRAFEAVPSSDDAIDVLAGHPAVDLVLCDGGPGPWPARADRIAAWSERARGRLRVMPGGGVTADAIDVLASRPRITDLHVGRLVREPDSVEGAVSRSKVAALVERLHRLRADPTRADG